jgi:hypothetical protein
MSFDRGDEPGPSLRSLWLEGALCDVDLLASDGARVPAHRIVLAAASPFFRALFLGAGRSMRDGGSPVVELPGIDGDSLRLLLDRVYVSTGSAAELSAVDSDTVQPLLAAASYLSVEGVARECCDFLRARLSSATAAAVLVLAESVGRLDLRKDAMRFLEANLHGMLSSGDAAVSAGAASATATAVTTADAGTFGRGHTPVVVSGGDARPATAEDGGPDATTLGALPFEAMAELLRSDELNLDSEADVATAALYWAAADPSHRGAQVAALVAAAREPAEPGWRWTDGGLDVGVRIDTAGTPCFAGSSPSTAADDAVAAAMRAAAAAAEDGLRRRSTEILELRAVGRAPRPRRAAPGRLVVVGGLEGEWRALKSVEVYSPDADTWQPGLDIPSPCMAICGCALADGAFALGGSAHATTALRLCRRSLRWSQVAAPPVGRINMGVAALAGDVYLVVSRERGL